MVVSQFGALLKEMEPFFNCALEPDQHDSCLIQMGIGISVQIEIDRHGYLLIGCRIGSLPMSRYRDNLIQQALKTNEISHPSNGIFGFSHKSSQLILFLRLNPATHDIHKILELLPPFIAKAKKWTDAVAQGDTPAIEEAVPDKASSGLFGLIS